MTMNNNFYTPEQARELYPQIVPVYQAAFAGDPWYEVSKCVDELPRRCIGGLSALAVGASCNTCERSTEQPAYQPDELINRFDTLASTRPTAWYIEQSERGIMLAAVAWVARPDQIAAERYADVSSMQSWLPETLADQPVVWLDEVFADRTIREGGNLQRFAAMNRGFIQRLGQNALAFRTVNPRMVTATKRDFEGTSSVFERNGMVPDRRDFVVLTAEGNV